MVLASRVAAERRLGDLRIQHERDYDDRDRDRDHDDCEDPRQHEPRRPACLLSIQDGLGAMPKNLELGARSSEPPEVRRIAIDCVMKHLVFTD